MSLLVKIDLTCETLGNHSMAITKTPPQYTTSVNLVEHQSSDEFLGCI